MTSAGGMAIVPNAVMASVMEEVGRERARQDKRWGGPDHDDEHRLGDWLDFIAMRCQIDRYADLSRAHPAMARRALVEIAALAVAAIESYDRISRSTPHD